MGYLVINRKIGERIQIGDNIEILVADYHKGRVDIAIDAPREIEIIPLKTHAEELFPNGDKHEN